MPIICIMNTLHDACSWTLISVLHSTTPTTSQLLVIAGYQMISLSILQVWSLLVVVVARCSHERRGSTFGIWRTHNDWMYAFVKLKSGITWSGPKQLSTICANKVYKMGDQDLWNNCEKTCWNVAFVFWLQPSTHLRLFEGPGSRASLQSWWWCLAETSLSPSFLSALWDFSLGNLCHLGLFFNLSLAFAVSGSGGARLRRYVVCTRVVWSRRAVFRRVLIDTSWRWWQWWWPMCLSWRSYDHSDALQVDLGRPLNSGLRMFRDIGNFDQAWSLMLTKPNLILSKFIWDYTTVWHTTFCPSRQSLFFRFYEPI